MGLIDKIKNLETKIKSIKISPKARRNIMALGVAIPTITACAKIAYSLLTGDHSQTHTVVDDGQQHIHYVCAVHDNPALAGFDANQDGRISDAEYNYYMRYCFDNGLEPQKIVPMLDQVYEFKPINDPKLMALYDFDGDGKWNVAEFRAYVKDKFPGILQCPNCDESGTLAKLEEILGGRVPFRDDL